MVENIALVKYTKLISAGISLLICAVFSYIWLSADYAGKGTISDTIRVGAAFVFSIPIFTVSYIVILVYLWWVNRKRIKSNDLN